MPVAQFIWLFFGLSGRVSRLVYFLANIFIGLPPLFAYYRLSLLPEDSGEGSGWALLFMFSFIVALWSQFALGVKRIHDFDKPGIIAAALFIPLVALIMVAVLCFYPGSPGSNQYGERTNEPK